MVAEWRRDTTAAALAAAPVQPRQQAAPAVIANERVRARAPDPPEDVGQPEASRARYSKVSAADRGLLLVWVCF